MTYTASELAILGKAYCEARGMTLAALGTLILENYKFFKLIETGRGAHSRSIEKASAWLENNWPDDLAWPADVQRIPPSEAA